MEYCVTLVSWGAGRGLSTYTLPKKRVLDRIKCNYIEVQLGEQMSFIEVPYRNIGEESFTGAKMIQRHQQSSPQHWVQLMKVGNLEHTAVCRQLNRLEWPLHGFSCSELFQQLSCSVLLLSSCPGLCLLLVHRLLLCPGSLQFGLSVSDSKQSL